MERVDFVHDPYKYFGSVEKVRVLVLHDDYMALVNESRKHQDECKVLIAKNVSLEEQISQLKKDIKLIIEK